MRRHIIILIFLLLIIRANSQDTILLNKISEYISEFENEAKIENSKTWDISFDIPIIIATENIVITNRNIENFNKYKNIYYGITNEIKPGAHTSISWKGIDWAFYTYPDKSFEIRKERLNLFFHEAFHRNQKFLKLNGEWTQCSHLNNSNARTLLKLEYNALLKCLTDINNSTSIIDALSFRAYRYYLYPKAYNEEQSIEICEGLANYTGLKLSGYTNDEVLNILKYRKSFNSQLFAYYTGALYGFILDKTDSTWRKEINNKDNFLYFTQKRLDLKLPEHLKMHIKKVRNNYGWDTISKTEKIISKKTKKQEKYYSKIFFKNPIIKIPRNLCTGGFIFNSSIIFPLAEGKVYNGFSTYGDWGELIAKDEIFFSDNILLPTPFEIKENLIIGNGWQIKLNNNWEIEQKSKRLYELVQKTDKENSKNK